MPDFGTMFVYSLETNQEINKRVLRFVKQRSGRVCKYSSRYTIFLCLKNETLQNKEPYQINVVHTLLGVCSYSGFL